MYKKNFNRMQIVVDETLIAKYFLVPNQTFSKDGFSKFFLMFINFFFSLLFSIELYPYTLCKTKWVGCNWQKMLWLCIV